MRIISLAAAAAAISNAAAMSRVVDNAAYLADDGRELMHKDHDGNIHFEECVGMDLEACKTNINWRVNNNRDNPGMFGGRTSMRFEVMRVRSAASADYFNIGIRVDKQTEDLAEGVLGDGMHYYPYEWCTSSEGCASIGPFDCDVGGILSFADCCTLIQNAVSTDVNGNDINCVKDYALGSNGKGGVDKGRVYIAVDDGDVVQHAPVNT